VSKTTKNWSAEKAAIGNPRVKTHWKKTEKRTLKHVLKHKSCIILEKFAKATKVGLLSLHGTQAVIESRCLTFASTAS